MRSSFKELKSLQVTFLQETFQNFLDKKPKTTIRQILDQYD